MKKTIFIIILALVLVLSATGGLVAADRSGDDSRSSGSVISSEDKQFNDNDFDDEEDVTSVHPSNSENELDNEQSDEIDSDDEEDDAPRSTTVNGVVTSVSSSRITVDAKRIRINRQTTIQGVLLVGATVQVKVIRADEYLVARSITVVTPGSTPPPTTVTIPAAPLGLTATATGSTQINLAWTDNSNNETGFKLQRAVISDFSGAVTTISLGAGVITYNNSGLTASTVYYYRVMATNTAGDSAPSGTATAITQAPSSVINGATVFTNNCTGCHGLSTARGTSRTQAQLITWIPGHNSSGLTAAEIAALAAYVKP